MQAKDQRVRRSIGYGRGFTLLELMIVVGIMGLMGTVSVGGYRAMRRGMEERGVMQNVNQFIRNAYQRAMIDRQPTAVYFWNETIQDESDDGTRSLMVVGHAVAVRRSGRITSTDGGLFDEFGDLEFLKGVDDDGEETDDEADSEGVTAYLYKCNGDETSLSGSRSVVSPSTIPKDFKATLIPMLSDADWGDNGYAFKVYGYKQKSGFSGWKVGDAYGFEFADITLPNNYIFETSYKTSVEDPIQEVGEVLKFSPVDSPSGETISICAIRPGSSGEPSAQKIGTTDSPDVALSNQNQ